MARGKWISVSGTYLRYEVSGEGAEWLILVHEMGGSLETWDDLMPHLPRRYRVLRYDLRGAGLSEKIRGPISLEAFVGDLLSLMAALGIAAPVTIVASSFGCAIALRTAILEPRLVKSLVLISPAIAAPVMGVEATLKLADRLETHGVGALCDELIDPHHPARSESERAFLLQAKGQFASNDPTSLAQTYRLMSRLDLESSVGGVGCPCLIVAGTRDRWRDPAALEALAGKIPHGRFARLDAGHYMLFHDVDLVAGALDGFLGAG
jgi:pimeloyl-ACP methyl ester carboxylesterase